VQSQFRSGLYTGEKLAVGELTVVRSTRRDREEEEEDALCRPVAFLGATAPWANTVLTAGYIN
jgi:hypothetical protein